MGWRVTYLWVLLLACITSPAFGQGDSRGVGVANAKTEASGIDFDDIYDGHHALLIGVDGYRNLKRLTGAVRDAQAMEVLLRDRGFTVTSILDEQATSRAIKVAIMNLKKVVKAKQRVIVYFAGHGISEGQGQSQMGYLMPIDGDAEVPSDKGIEMRWLQQQLDSLPAKHVLFAADACYSGIAIQTRGTPRSTKTPDYVSLISKDKVRLTLTAGTDGQEVIDNHKGNGLFTHYLLDALKGSADRDRDGFVTSLEIAQHLKKNVVETAKTIRPNEPQNPQIGRMGQGEMLFRASKGRDSAFWSRWLNAPEGHWLGVSNEHPAIDELKAYSNAIGELSFHVQAKTSSMLKTYTADGHIETAPDKHSGNDLVETASAKLSNNRIHGVTVSKVESAREGTGVMVTLAPDAKPYQRFLTGFIEPHGYRFVKDGVDQADCKATSEALNHGLVYTLLQRSGVTVRGMNKSYIETSTAATDFEEYSSSYVSKISGRKTYRSNDGLSLCFKLVHKLYVHEGGGETDSSESKTELYHRVRLESPGQQITEFKFLNGKAYKQNDGACEKFAPALKRVGFRFRRVLPESRDARRVPREQYVFTLSGSPDKRGLDGEFYRTKAGRIKPAGETHKSKSGDIIVTEAWRLVAGESKGKIVSTRGGFHKAVRRTRNGRLLEERFLDANGTPVAPNFSTTVFSAETLKTHPHCSKYLGQKAKCLLKARAKAEFDDLEACKKIVEKPCGPMALGRWSRRVLTYDETGKKTTETWFDTKDTQLLSMKWVPKRLCAAGSSKDYSPEACDDQPSSRFNNHTDHSKKEFEELDKDEPGTKL